MVIVNKSTTFQKYVFNILSLIFDAMSCKEHPHLALHGFAKVVQHFTSPLHFSHSTSNCFTYLISMMRSFLGQRKNYIKKIERLNKVNILILSRLMERAFYIVFSLTQKRTHHHKALCTLPML